MFKYGRFIVATKRQEREREKGRETNDEEKEGITNEMEIFLRRVGNS
jgi:hypothetical protein